MRDIGVAINGKAIVQQICGFGHELSHEPAAQFQPKKIAKIANTFERN